MKKIIVFLVIAVLVVGGVYLYMHHTAQTPSTGVVSNSIIYPAGGETFKQGNTYTLIWDDSDTATTTTQIFLVNTALEAEGASVSISDRIYGISDTGSYAYTVPLTLPNGTYKFEIGTLTSNTFQISSTLGQ